MTTCNLIPAPTEHERRDGKPPFVPTAPSSGDAWDQLRGWGGIVGASVWVAIGTYLVSSPGDLLGLSFLLAIAWLFSSLGLAGFCVVLVVVAVRALMARDYTRFRRVVAFLAPFPIALSVMVGLSITDIPFRARFELSEAALNDAADSFEESGEKQDLGVRRVGLYLSEVIYRWENCTVVVTGSVFLDEFGFARCDGAPPEDRPWDINLEHLTNAWWTWHNGD